MSDITLSAGVRSNLLSLQGISQLLTTTQGRLATGKKVNSALDNPTSFFVARNLSDRANKLNALLDGINNGISTIQAASRGLDSIYKALQGAQGIIDSVKADVGKASNQVTGAVTTLTGATTLTSLGYANNDIITFTTPGGTTTVNLGTIGTQTVQDLVDKINAQGNGVYTASLNAAPPPGANRLVITSTNSAQFTVSGTTGAAITATLGAAVNSVVGTVDQNKLNSYAKQFNDILRSIDQFAADSSFNGVNLLRAGNDLDIQYNEDGTSKSTVKSRDITYDTYSLALISESGAATVSDFTTKVQTLKDSLSSTRIYQSEYAALLSTAQNRQDFSKSVINILKVGSDNLTNADQNEEAANVLALQTRQQLSQSALNLAVQADQAVLQLLRG